MIVLFMIEILIFASLITIAWFLIGRPLFRYLDDLTKKDKHGIGPAEFKKKIAELECRIKELEQKEEKEESLAEMQKLHNELEDLKVKLGSLDKPS